MSKAQSTRRTTLKWIGAGAAASAVAGVGLGAGIRAQSFDALPPEMGNAPASDAHWLALLAKSQPTEHRYEAEVEGTIPAGLNGSLYRNGPGLFDRGDSRKQSLLDGDGMIRHFQIGNGKAHFQNRYVQTPKLQMEEKAGRFLFPTWTTLQPKWSDSLTGIPSVSQAGVTAVVKDGRLFAIDEVGQPWEMDVDTLDTIGEFAVGDDNVSPAFKAHTKTDSRTGDWVLVGTSSGRVNKVQVAVRDRNNQLKGWQEHTLPRASYFHDFFATEHFVILHLQPMMTPPWAMLAGIKSFTDSFKWEPEQGTILMVLDKSGTKAPVFIDAPGVFMWHTLNAWEHGNTILADFVGYDDPNHFIGEQALLRQIMQGRLGDAGAPGTLRRYTINLDKGTAREETTLAGSYEFPMMNPAMAGRANDFGYVTVGTPERSVLTSGIGRVDLKTNQLESFDFGADYYAGEPIFAADRNDSMNEASGWILSEILDGTTGKSGLAIFDAAHIPDGPLATIKLGHHLPMSFHGWWDAA
jgi:all-trans-8'-apo-beta-carotenal 15,15'-oxygenase